MKKNKLLNICTLLIIIFIPFLEILSFYLEMYHVIDFYDFLNPGIVFYITLPILLYVYLIKIIKENRKLTIFDYAFIAFFLFGIFSVIFAENRTIAIFGKELRHHGFLAVINFYLLIMNWKDIATKKDIERYLKIIVILAVINSLYGLLQYYTHLSFIIRYYDTYGLIIASGFCGHFNFFGTLMVTTLGIMINKYLIEKNHTIIDLLVISLLFIGLINCQSTGPFLAFLITIIFSIVYLFIKKKLILKKLIFLLVTILPMFFAINNLNNYRNSHNFIVNRYKVDEYSNEGIKRTITSGGTHRLKIWKNTISVIKERPLLGYGFDNFYLVYPNTNEYKVINEYLRVITHYDNAHNVYLNILVSSGIFGLLPYLTICLLTFIKCLKTKNDLTIILMGGFVAYSIQAFSNISVIQIAPIYFLLIGFILAYDNDSQKNS